jgi:hypothetical protein
MKPSLHKPVPMESRVIVPKHYLDRDDVKGTVVGVASMHVIFTYIVLLDEPIDTEYGTCRAIVVNGPELRGENGEDWRLND